MTTEETTEEARDRLAHMIELQEQLEDRFFHSVSLTLEERVHWTKEMIVAIVRELGELMDGIPKSKHWKAQYSPIDRNNILEELVDITHFLLALIIIWRFDADQWYEAYVKKHEENLRRYASGY